MKPEPSPASTICANFVLKRPSENGEGFILDVSLNIVGNGVTAIFGHSGSGKTTLLRCIAGLEQADRAKLVVNDQVWSDQQFNLPVHKRPIGYVFQEASLFPHLTAKANLDYAIKRADTAVDDQFLLKVLSVLGIENLLDKYPSHLSGGERQRVAIARALLIQPRLLLMDEPLASLDLQRKLEVLPYLEEIRQQFNIPIIYVSHSVDEVARLADQVVIMEQGKVIAQGELTELFSRIDLPLQLEDEVGAILKGRVFERDSKWHLIAIDIGDQKFWLRDNGCNIGEIVRIHIHARDVSLALSNYADSSILNRLAVEVDQIAPDRDESMVLVRLRCADHYLIARITQKSLSQLGLSVKQKLWAQIKSAALI